MIFLAHIVILYFFLTLNLLKLIFQGAQKQSIEQLREMVNEGIQPENFLNDLLEIIYFIQQKKSLGNFESELSISEAEQDIINSISDDINMTTLIVFWQFILKVIDELSVVSNPILSLEMLVVRLVHLKDMPTYDKLLDSFKKNNLDETKEDNNIIIESKNKKKIINDENQITKISKNQIKNTIQTKPVLSSSKQKSLSTNIVKEKVSSFVDLIYLAGKRWVITLSKETGEKTFSETQDIRKKELLNNEKKGEVYKKFISIFSDAELLEVKKND